MPISSKSFTESTGETIVNIGQYLAKIWTKYDRLVTLTTELHYRTACDSANITLRGLANMYSRTTEKMCDFLSLDVISDHGKFLTHFIALYIAACRIHIRSLPNVTD